MKYLDEYRDGRVAAKILAHVERTVTRPWTIMEVCGGQTHTIVKQGLDELLGDAIEMVHGPGCPVCVTPLEQIDKAHAIARLPGVTFASFGDMLRVPGSQTDLLRLKSEGADVRIVYAPLDAVRLAQEHPERQVVFFAVGFETTAPANALAVSRAKALGVRTNPAFAGTYSFGRDVKFADVFPLFLDRLPDGSVVMCHPGFVDEELRKLDPDSASLSRSMAAAFLPSMRISVHEPS